MGVEIVAVSAAWAFPWVVIFLLSRHDLISVMVSFLTNYILTHISIFVARLSAYDSL